MNPAKLEAITQELTSLCAANDFAGAEKLCGPELRGTHWFIFAHLLIFWAVRMGQPRRAIELWQAVVLPRIAEVDRDALDATISHVLCAYIPLGLAAQAQAEFGPRLLDRVQQTSNLTLLFNAACLFAQMKDVPAALRLIREAHTRGKPLSEFRQDPDLAPIQDHPAVRAYLDRGERAFLDGACVASPGGLTRLTLRHDTIFQIRPGEERQKIRHTDNKSDALIDFMKLKAVALASGPEVDDPGERALVQASNHYLESIRDPENFIDAWNVLRLEWDYEDNCWPYWMHPYAIGKAINVEELWEYPFSDQECPLGHDNPIVVPWGFGAVVQAAETRLCSGRPESQKSFMRAARAIANLPSFKRLKPRSPFYFVLQEHDAGVEFVAEVGAVTQPEIF